MIHALVKSLNIDYQTGGLNRENEIKKEIWRKLIATDPIYKIECPIEYLKEFGEHKIARVKDMGILESVEELDHRLVPYYNIIKWIIEDLTDDEDLDEVVFSKLHTTTRYNQKCFVFDTVNYSNECLIFKLDGKRHRGYDDGMHDTVCLKFNIMTGEFHSVKNVADFIHKCAQDLASFYTLKKMIFNTDKYNTIVKDNMSKIWQVCLKHDISLLIHCPTEFVTKRFLDEIGREKLGNIHKTGMLDESLSTETFDKFYNVILELGKFSEYGKCYDVKRNETDEEIEIIFKLKITEDVEDNLFLLLAIAYSKTTGSIQMWDERKGERIGVFNDLEKFVKLL